MEGNKTAAGTFVAWFKAECFGEKCEVEVSVDLRTLEPAVCASWNRFLGQPVTVSLADLKDLSMTISEAARIRDVLRESVKDAQLHQVRFSRSGVSLIVTRPLEKPPFFSLSVGNYSRGGDLDRLKSDDVDAVIVELETLQARVVEHAKRAKST